jgi:Na+-transporting methylmalonyl-CoA/oxaloacetate decarboxylase beta subunit
MHFIIRICEWLEQTGVGTSIRESLWLFPVIETVHIFGIILLVGATSILDLRLMGLTFRDEPVSKLVRRFLPWAWAGFLIQVVTGLLLFSSEATKMYGNLGFDIKMLLIVVAGVNAFVFHEIAYRSVGKWDHDPVAPIGARVAGLISILLWFGIVAAGRWIAYV